MTTVSAATESTKAFDHEGTLKSDRFQTICDLSL